MVVKTDRSFDRRTLLKLAGATAAIAACGGGAATASAAPSSAATAAATASAAPSKVSGTLSVYSALNESTNNDFFAAFNKVYPDVKINVLPLAATENELLVATADPTDVDCERTLGFATGRHVKMAVADAAEIAQRIEQVYHGEGATHDPELCHDPAGTRRSWSGAGSRG